jgi:hypothetical protein
MSKSQRKTLFLSFLDATQEDMSELQEVLKQTNISDDYRIIATPRPIQALGEEEMNELVSLWLGDESNQERWKKSMRLFHEIAAALTNLREVADTSKLNEKKLFSQLESLAYNVNSALQMPGGTIPIPYDSLQSTGSEYIVERHIKNINEISPKEGEMW